MRRSNVFIVHGGCLVVVCAVFIVCESLSFLSFLPVCIFMETIINHSAASEFHSTEFPLLMIFIIRIFRWFREDANIVPVSYVLQPISVNLPNFLEKVDREKFLAAKSQWNGENDQMHEAIIKAARKVFADQPDKVHKYLMSGKCGCTLIDRFHFFYIVCFILQFTIVCFIHITIVYFILMLLFVRC